MTHPYFRGFDADRPMILGHRGAAGTAPENTLPSFERCLALGGDAIETDVQVTSDGVPVLLHDASLARVSDRATPVASIPRAELESIDAGYHFTIDDRGETEPPDDAAFRGGGYRVPTVEEAFRALPHARFNLEIKTEENDAVARVVELVASLGRADRTLLTAGDDAIMLRLRKEIAARGVAVATSASISEIVAVVRSAVDGGPPPSGIQALQIPTRFANAELVTPELVEHAHRHGIQIHVWTINDPEEMGRLFDLGVDGIVTDFPERAARRIAERRRALEPRPADCRLARFPCRRPSSRHGARRSARRRSTVPSWISPAAEAGTRSLAPRTGSRRDCVNPPRQVVLNISSLQVIFMSVCIIMWPF